MLKPRQRYPTEREKRNRSTPVSYMSWLGAAYPMPGDLLYCPVGAFLPRDVSEFIWAHESDSVWGDEALWRTARRQTRDSGS